MVRDYLAGPGGKPLVVYGPSGSGNTYVVAKAAAEEAERANTDARCMAVRFLGTSPQSSNALDLLASLYAQLCVISRGRAAYTNGGEAAGDSLPECAISFEELRKALKAALKTWKWGPLTISLDSVDQLDDSNGGRRLDWLPLEHLSEQIRMVISTLPDELSPPDKRPFRCLSQMERRLVPSSEADGRKRNAAGESRSQREHEKLFVRVEPLKDAADLLEHLLKLQGRCAT